MEDTPFEDRVVPKVEIDWERSCWWWYPITRTVHPAMRITALVTSFVALLILGRGFALAWWLFDPRWSESASMQWNWRMLGGIRLPDVEVGQSVLFSAIGVREIAFLTFSLFWITAVCGWFGGLLARRAAVELGGRTIAPWGESIRLISSRWVSMLWVTGMHLVALTVLLLVPFFFGLLARLGPLTPVAGVLLLLSFPIAFAVGRLAISMVFCFPLAITAVVLEKKADAFEGFSRANACFFQRPVLTAVLIITITLAGWVGFQLVYWLLLVGWHWMRDAFLSGAGLSIHQLMGEPTPELSARAGSLVEWIKTGGWLTRTLVTSFFFSYFWSGAAAIYLILRKSVYNTEMDEIDTPDTGVLTTLPQIATAPSTDAPAAN